MVGISIASGAKNFSENVRASRYSEVVSLKDDDGGAFAHYKSVSCFVKGFR